MLTYNTMRFGTDEFSLAGKRALLISKNPLNPNRAFTHIKNFTVAGENLTDNNARFFFHVVDTDAIYSHGRYNDDVYFFYISASGKLLTSHVSSFTAFQTIELDDLFSSYENANLSNLQTVDGDDTFAGLDIYPIIALEGNDDLSPKAKLSAVFEKRVDVLDKEIELNYAFGDENSLKKILAYDNPEITITGNADHSWHAYYLDANGNWSDKIIPSKIDDELIGAKVKRVKTIETFHVDAVNGNNAVARANWHYSYSKDANAIVFGDTADVYSILKNYHLPLKYCAVIVKHEALDGAKIQAFARFDPTVYSVNNRNIGTGSGSSQTITLPTAKMFNPSTLKIYVGGSRFYDFTFNVNDNTITLTATSGAAITASYNYNYQPETWIKLTADKTQYDFSDGLFTTRYYCTNVKDYGDNVLVSAIRLQFIRGDAGNVPHVHSFTAGWSV